jgi:hypothetical protein
VCSKKSWLLTAPPLASKKDFDAEFLKSKQMLVGIVLIEKA